MKVQASLRNGLKALVAKVPNVGTVDTLRLDPDDVARKLGTNGTGGYWSVQVRAVADRPAELGAGTSRKVFRSCAFRLEGWRGFVGTTDATEEFEGVVDDVLDRLQTGHSRINGYVPGFQDWRGLGASPVDIVRVGANGRAHHAVIDGQAEFYVEAR